MSTCHGCRHYRPIFQECGQLQGWLYCTACDRKWSVDERVGCPKCAEFKATKMLWECPDAVRSSHCPGFEAAVPDVVQRGLFD